MDYVKHAMQDIPLIIFKYVKGLKFKMLKILYARNGISKFVLNVLLEHSLLITENVLKSILHVELQIQ